MVALLAAPDAYLEEVLAATRVPTQASTLTPTPNPNPNPNLTPNPSIPNPNPSPTLTRCSPRRATRSRCPQRRRPRARRLPPRSRCAHATSSAWSRRGSVLRAPSWWPGEQAVAPGLPWPPGADSHLVGCPTHSGRAAQPLSGSKGRLRFDVTAAGVLHTQERRPPYEGCWLIKELFHMQQTKFQARIVHSHCTSQALVHCRT